MATLQPQADEGYEGIYCCGVKYKYPRIAESGYIGKMCITIRGIYVVGGQIVQYVLANISVALLIHGKVGTKK